MFRNMVGGNTNLRRNDSSDAVYQVDSVNTAANEKRLHGLLCRNREELEQHSWLSVGYTHGDINTSDGIIKILSRANLRNLLAKIPPK